MITRSDLPRRDDRAFRLALLGSLLVHVLFVVVAIFTSDVARRAFHVDAPLHRRAPDEVVTISSSLRLEKRAKPVPIAQRRPHAARQPPAPRRAPSPRAAQQPPQPQQRSAVPAALPVTADVRKVALPTPKALERELAQLRKRAVAQPTSPPARPTYAPRPTRGEGKQLASLGKPATSRNAAAGAASAANRFSQERLAQIERDLAKTIAQTRSETNPLRTIPREPPAAPKHYRIQMQGALHALRRGEGYYYPVRSWRANGLDYYYVSYEFTWPDGTYETGSVPWPIHFMPGVDPFASKDPALVYRTPLPPPPPDYMPPGTLGKALRAYFPKLVFSDGGP